MAFDLGDPYTTPFLVVDSTTGLPANGGVVVETITLPDATVVTPTPSNAVVGTYLPNYTPTIVGHYTVRWVVTGANACAGTDVFDVVDDTAAIVSLTDVRQHLKLTSTAHDVQLQRFRDACEALAESYTGACLRRKVVVGELSSGNVQSIQLRNQPVQSITAASENSVVITGGYYRLNPPSGILTRTSGYPYYATLWLPGYLNISIDYIAGYGNTAPADLKQAILDMVRILWNDSQRGGGVTKPGGGDDDWTPSANTLPPSVRFVLDRYIQLGAV